MIHINVAFLVIRSTFNTIVKILINANKYTGDGLLRARITYYKMVDEKHHLDVHY